MHHAGKYFNAIDFFWIAVFSETITYISSLIYKGPFPSANFVGVSININSSECFRLLYLCISPSTILFVDCQSFFNVLVLNT